MNLPPLPPTRDTTSQVSGNVTVHPSAAIAPGVVLKADADSYLLIGEGVCIGAGSVLHVCNGTLMIESGVILGTGVLIFGAGAIGVGACVGAWSTVINPTLAAQAVVEPNSLVGDRSRTLPVFQGEPMGSDSTNANGAGGQTSETPNSSWEKNASGGNASLQESTIFIGSTAPVGSPLNPYPIQPPLSAPPLKPEWQLKPQANLASQEGFSETATQTAETSSAFLEADLWRGNSSAQTLPIQPSASETASGSTPPTSGKKLGAPVYGKEAVHRLINALFPNRHLSNPTQLSEGENATAEGEPPKLP